jgi:putative tricarboxylic transport membrane protein
MSGQQADRPVPRHRPVGELVIALGVIALAIVIYWQTRAMPVSPIYAQAGPTIAPKISAAGLGLLGLALLASALRGGWQPDEERETAPDLPALLWVLSGLVLNVLLIGVAGFTVASILLFVCVARGFGSRAFLRNTLIGAAFALIAYFGFAEALGINIGAGWVENGLDSLLRAKGH